MHARPCLCVSCSLNVLSGHIVFVAELIVLQIKADSQIFIEQCGTRCFNAYFAFIVSCMNGG